MKISQTIYSLLLIGSLAIFSTPAQAQEEIEPSFQSFQVGSLEGDQATILPQSEAFEQWIVSRLPEGSIDPSSSTEDFSDSLVNHPQSGWTYVARWQQGPDEILIRFQLITRNEKLTLLEVGSYQACICEGCTDLQFSKEIPACECEGGDCSFLMIETLH